jgi:hypothetical protein
MAAKSEDKNDDYWIKLEKKNKILNLMESGDWQSVLEQYDKPENYREPLLVWLRPSLEMLKFVENCLIEKLNIQKVRKFDLIFF